MTTYAFLLAMGTPPSGGGSALGPLVLIPAFLAIFYFILLRPMKRQQQKVQEFQSALKVGDRIVTSGGIYGTLTRVGDQSAQVQIADKVRIEVSRNAIVGYQGQEPVATEGQSQP
jgi:preprotein translocase subunit YajC